MTIENVKVLGLFQPIEIRGRNTRKLGCLYLCFKNFPYIQKKKKKYTEIICAKHLTANKYYWC